MNIKILPYGWDAEIFSIENPNYYSILRTDLSIDGFMRDKIRPSGCFSIVVNPQSEDIRYKGGKRNPLKYLGNGSFVADLKQFAERGIAAHNPYVT